MLGHFQQSHLRIEVPGNKNTIRDSLLKSDYLRQWLTPQTLSSGLPETLEAGLTFTSSLPGLTIQHHVALVNSNCLRMILSQGIDGYHEWVWGDGWVQSRLEGISLLPLNLGQTLNLLKLRQFLISQDQDQG